MVLTFLILYLFRLILLGLIVVFTYDSNGNYEKLISDIGEIYYSYVQSEEKNNLKDYYSPFQNISAPSIKDLYFTKIEYNLGKTFQLTH